MLSFSKTFYLVTYMNIPPVIQLSFVHVFLFIILHPVVQVVHVFHVFTTSIGRKHVLLDTRTFG